MKGRCPTTEEGKTLRIKVGKKGRGNRGEIHVKPHDNGEKSYKRHPKKGKAKQ